MHISFDINQAKKQFELLGHQPEKVCLRFFRHKDDPRKNEDKGRKAENLSLKKLEKTVKRHQSEEYGAYFVVNGNGHNDNQIHHGFAIFYEHDDLDKSLQELLWKKLGLPAPTFQVDTGGRSIHSYWVFNEPIEINLWKSLQSDLLDLAKADRTIKNPSRVMRLAGACHISPAGIFPSELINVTGNKYTYEELRSIIPEKAVESSPQLQTTANYSPKSNWSDVDWARSYLETLSPSRADDYNEWLAIGMALKAVSESLFTDWDNWSRQSTKYKPGECARKWESFKNPTDPKTEIAKLGSWAKKDGWVSPFKRKTDTSIKSKLSSKSNVNVDNGLLSTGVLTTEGDDESVIQLIVNAVNAILGSNLEEFLERHKLDTLYNQYKDKITRKLFDSIVASERVKISEVLPEDELRLKSLVDYSQTKINWDEVLPAPLARDITHDADVLNIDAVMIWQLLLSAVSSLSGQFKLNEHGGIPAVNWTCSVAESGSGKTRADNLVLSPLREIQLAADEEFKEKVKEYKQELRKYEKSLKDGDEVEEPTEPTLRKHLFEVATIQSIFKRLSEQNGRGSLWARDEIKGLFSSLNQFSNGDSEAMELLLNLWDNKSVFIDRVDIENSYSIANTALSITGAIQDSVFRKAFKDENDGNGLQARFLFAVPQMRKKRYCKGYCKLSDVLPHLYRWLDSANANAKTVELAPDAQKYYANLVNDIGDQIEQISHPGIRTWMNKVNTHILRIALALHLIECYYKENSKDIKTLSLDTLKRAVAFAQYYRSAFHILQEKVSPSDDIASIMLQIRDKALRKHPDGISARDVYRGSRIIQNRAKSAGREASAYVVDLFEKMKELGYGDVVRKDRAVRFVAFKNQTEEKTTKGVDSADNSLNSESKPDGNEKVIVNTPCCQKPIVNVDNQISTEIRTEGEYKNQQLPEPEPKVDNEGISLLKVEKSKDVSNYIGHQVEIRGMTGKTMFRGTIVENDAQNGVIIFETEKGDRKKASYREAYVV